MEPGTYLGIMCGVCLCSFVAALFANRKNAKSPTEDTKTTPELYTDYVAGALLLPLDPVYEYLERQNFRIASPRQRVKIVKQLCKIYNVDEVLACRRIGEIYKLKKENNHE